MSSARRKAVEHIRALIGKKKLDLFFEIIAEGGKGNAHDDIDSLVFDLEQEEACLSEAQQNENEEEIVNAERGCEKITQAIITKIENAKHLALGIICDLHDMQKSALGDHGVGVGLQKDEGKKIVL